MQITNITTDDTLRSTLEYGTPEFPFACYLDKLACQKNSSIAWHWHREFEISYAIDGIVHCFVDDECINLQPGEALFINSELIHHFEGDGGIMYNIIFMPEFIADMDSAVFQKSIAPYLNSNCKYLYFHRTDARYSRLLNEIKEIGTLSGAKNYGRNRELELLYGVTGLWLQIAEFTENSLVPQKRNADMLRQARLRKMIQYIQSNYSERITLSEIAEQANISTSEALRCFKIGLKTTPINYLIDYRLGIAFSRLTATRDPVYQIASSVGFENTSYFCQKFKERYGSSPMGVRKNV